MSYFDPQVLRSYLLNNVGQRESGGNATAQNPSSSAYGVLQITRPTWQGLQRAFPDAGLTDPSDPEQQIKGVSLQAENEMVPQFKAAGITPTLSDVGLMNSLGTPAALKMRQADPQTAVGSFLHSGAIQKNPTWFPQGAQTTAQDAMNRIAPMNQNGTSTPQGTDGSDGTMGNASSMNPTETATIPADNIGGDTDNPPPTPSEEAPESNDPLSRALNFLGAWGSGADGKNFASGLGAGNAAGMKELDQMDTEQKQAQDANDDRQLNDWKNGLLAQNVHNSTLQTRADVGKQVAEMVNNGMSPTSAIAMISGHGGTLSYDPSMATRGTSMFEAPVPMSKVMPDGSVHTVQMTTNRRTGLPSVYDMTTNQPTEASGLINLNDPTYRATQAQSVKDEDAFNNATQSANNAADTAAQVQDILPKMSAGPDIMSRLGREYMTVTGLPINGGEPEAMQRGNQLVSQMKTQALGGLHGLGRLDLPEVQSAMSSVASPQNSSPGTIYATTKEIQNQAAYQRQMSKDWANASQAEKLQGIGAWRTKYLNDDATRYRPSDFMGNVAAYNKAYSGQSAPAPTSHGIQTPTTGVPRTSNGTVNGTKWQIVQ